jgi:UDP:flavonoid glycosyltransferase YjiC (YdhE family)
VRVLLVTWQWPSHLFPMVPLGWALQAAGHDVYVASAPALSTSITHAGLPAVAVGADAADLVAMSTSPQLATWHRQTRWAPDWPAHPERLTDEQVDVLRNLGRKQVAIAGAMVDDLVAFGRFWRPDLVVHDAVSFAGAVTGRVLGVPTVRHMWGSSAQTRLEVDQSTGRPLPEYVELFDRFGAQPLLEPAVWVNPCPPRMRLPGTGQELEVRYVPYNGPGGWPGWLVEAPRRPRVCVTFGVTATTIHGDPMVRLLRQVVDAVLDAGAEPVVATSPSERGLIGELPAGARVVELLPLRMLLPTCAGIVHLGGAGSVLTAAVHGVPQLAITLRPEQMLTGDRLVAAGAGRHLIYNDLLSDQDGAGAATAIRGALGELLDNPAYALAAADLSLEIARQPAPASLVPHLQALCERVAV